MDRPIAAQRRRSSPLRPIAMLDRLLRRAGDARVATVLILAAVAWNLVSAIAADPAVVQHPSYLALIAAIGLSGLAAVAVRLPSAWREWRAPGPFAGRGARSAVLELSWHEAGARSRMVAVADEAGYRFREQTDGGGWRIYGVRRGWSRFAALGSHVALVGLIVAAAASGATARESVFSLHPGEQALLDAPRAGFSDAVRLDRFDPEFGADGRPTRLDTSVTFLRGGQPVSVETLQVNSPASFGGYLVHGWTYGPSARIRVSTLAGRPLHDAAVPLDEERGGIAVGGVELPAVGVGIGLALVEPHANVVSITALGADGSVHTARLQPASEQRLGSVMVALDSLDAYVTFLSRQDPLLPLVIASSALLVGSLIVAFWMPRRRLLIRQDDGRVTLLLRGERFDDAQRELETLVARLRRATE